MAPTNQIRLAELDFDQVLQNVITFMKADPTFADYDFGGSGLRMLARTLAYSIFYEGHYLTQVGNEAFLDTAQLRSSVASLARSLGYNLKGVQSARLLANTVVQLSDTSAAVVTLPKNTQFALQANTSFTFYNTDDVVLTKNVSTLLYEATDVQLVEGAPHTFRFVVDLTNPTQRFVIPNANVDYTTVTVQVQDSLGSNTLTTFIRAENFLTITGTDPVFWVQESFDGFAELKFGNGIVGKPLVDGNIVIANYYISHGTGGNGIRGPFEIATANINGFQRGVTVVDADSPSSSGGSDVEDLDNARFLAPLVYQAQNRCVTANDYKSLILANYGANIGAINVFGGEQGDPNDPKERPAFGRVFIALKPVIGLRFTDAAKENIIQNIVAPRAIVGILPEIIDPDYVYIVVSTSVKYDPKATTRTKLQLQNAIADAIEEFAQDNIEKFDAAFRFSKFTRIIDDVDDAILSSLTRLDLEKRVFPTLGKVNQFTLKYGSPIRVFPNASAVVEATSHRFTYTNDAGVQKDNCFFYESDGILHIAYRDTNNLLVVHQKNVGTVDVTNGVVYVTNFAPDAIENDNIDIRVRVMPVVTDYIPHLKRLYTLDPADIAIQLLNDALATVDDQTSFFAGGILP